MTIRFGLLGAGRIGKVHAKAISADGNARLVAVGSDVIAELDDSAAIRWISPNTRTALRARWSSCGPATAAADNRLADSNRAIRGKRRMADSTRQCGGRYDKVPRLEAGR